MKTWTRDDKSGWGDGPWQSEPDKGQWVDPDTGLDCLIVRNYHGALCGYVGVPEHHPLFGCCMSVPREHGITAHEYITFAGPCLMAETEEAQAQTICHTGDDVANQTVWWIGFDCSHHNDYSPRMKANLAHAGDDALLALLSIFETEGVHRASHYRDWKYVQDEVTALAGQLNQLTQCERRA